MNFSFSQMSKVPAGSLYFSAKNAVPCLQFRASSYNVAGRLATVKKARIRKSTKIQKGKKTWEKSGPMQQDSQLRIGIAIPWLHALALSITR